MLSLSALPFSFKLIPAVICDSKFIKRLGRRRTWVIIGHMIIASALITFYLCLDSWIEQKSTHLITVTMSIMYTGSVIQDITADGWILNKLPDKLTYAGPIQSLGTKIGILFGFSIFSIIEWAAPWFSFNHWMISVATALIVTNIVILTFVTEGDESKDLFKNSQLFVDNSE